MGSPTATPVQLLIAGHDPISIGDDVVRFVVDGHPLLVVQADPDAGTITVGTCDEDGDVTPIHTVKTLVLDSWNLRVVDRHPRWPIVQLDAPDAAVATERALEWARSAAELPEPLAYNAVELGDGRWQVEIEGW